MLLWTISPPLHAQSGRQAQARQLYTSVEASSDLALAASLNNLPSEFEVEKIGQYTDRNGQVHVRYQLETAGFELLGAQILIHELSNGEFLASYPRLLPQPAKLDLIPEENLWRSKLRNTILDSDFTFESFKYQIVPEELNLDSDAFVLAAVIELHQSESHRHDRLILSAKTGEQIVRYHVDCSLVPGAAQTMHSGSQMIETSQEEGSGLYILLDETRGNGIHTLGVDGELVDEDNEWNFTEDSQQMALDIHYGLGVVHDFILDRYQRNSLDWNGLAIEASTGEAYASAFYIGGGNMAFGAGNSDSAYDLPFSSLDVVGHELAHGLSAYSNNLIYSGESGGLNEAFSDILGVTVEWFYHPEVSSWTIGDQFSSTVAYFRNMAYPNEKEMPDTYGGDFWSSNLEVHSGSSIANFWFYLLATGQSGINDVGYIYQVPELGHLPVMDVVYETWTYWLSSGSNYADAALASVLVATEFYGSCSPEVNAIQEAWAAVNVLTTSLGRIDVSQNRVCASSQPIVFTAEALGEFVSWDFGDDDFSVENPAAHIYETSGIYSPIASFINCSGDTLYQAVESIQVDFENPELCDTTTFLPSQDIILKACGGILIDDGGIGDYSNDFESTILLDVDSAVAYEIEFIEFDLESNYDFIHIYTDESVEPIYSFTGNVNPETIIVSGAGVRVEFITDFSVVRSGFVIEYQCLFPASPVANFEANEEYAVCQNWRTYTSTSTGFPSSYSWLLNNSIEVGVEEILNLNLSDYPDGIYELTLIVCNELGCSLFDEFEPVTIDRSEGSCDVIRLEEGELQFSICAGSLVDDGGFVGPYSNNVNSFIELTNNEGLYYEFNFRDFHLEQGFDNFTIYDLNNSNPVALANYTGALEPFVEVFPSSNLLIEFQTDVSVVRDGFLVEFHCVSPLSAETYEAIGNWEVYPNPFSEQLALTGLSSADQWEIEIMTMDGRLVNQWSLSRTSAGLPVQINMKSLVPGMYLVSARSNRGQKMVKRVVKQ